MVEPSLYSQASFEKAFIQFRDELVSYLFRLTGHRQDAEDLAQSTFLKAHRSISRFKGRSGLKTWVFAIATNLARDHFRVQKRWFEDSQDRCRTDTQASPEKVQHMHDLVDRSLTEAYEFQEHISYCFSCLAKTLLLEQQLVLILKEVYQFKISEICEILQRSEGKVKHALADARGRMMDIFDRRCSLINKQGMCEQCSEICGFVNPKQLEQQARLQLVQEAQQEGANPERLLALRAQLVQGVDPLRAPGAEMHTYLLGLVEEAADEQASERQRGGKGYVGAEPIS